MKIFYSIILFFFSLALVQAQQTFPISPIGTQHVFPGAKITTHLSAVNHDLPSIHLAAINLPNFGSFEDEGKGFGAYTFEPNEGDEGTYLVTLQAISGTDTSLTSFQVIVQNLPNGNKYYVDPINGNNNNPGTESQPWKTLQDVFNTGKTITDNSIVYLRSGNHGAPVVNKLQNKQTYIVAEKGHTPMFEKLNFFLAKNWVLSGIKISPEADSTSAKGNYLRIQPTCSNITVENCEIYGTSDVMNWTTNQDWYDNAGDGVLINGKNDLFRNNYIYNVYFGLTVDGADNIISHNLLNNFGADGFRGLGNGSQFLYNRIQNALVDDYATGNHDDGFQSWATNGPVKNITLKGNQIFSHTDPTLPLKTSILQGLVNFDGFSERWVIEDNIVLTDHPHGITLLGAKFCRVNNNTVINNPLHLFSYGNPPWIRIGPHKNGAKSSGNLTRNNLMAFNYQDGDPGSFDHNLIANNTDHFVDYAHWNFHLKPGAAPINAGTFVDGSTLDNDEKIRLDSFPDIGAFEFGPKPYDFEKPTQINNIQVQDIQPTSISLSWAAATDNYIVKRYIIKSNQGKTIRTDSTFVKILDLPAGTNQDLNIYTEDYAGNLSEKVTYNFTTPDFLNDSVTISISAHPNDQLLKSNGTMLWVGLQNNTVGGFTYFYDDCAALPFQLPTIPNGYKIAQAKLTIEYNRIVNNPVGNADLYVLGLRNTPSIGVADNWQGNFGESPNAVALEDDFISNTKTLGALSTADTTNIKLAEYINNQSSIANKFLILRINSDKENESNYRFYQFASADHPNTLIRPKLELLLTKLVPYQAISNKQLSVYPNPIMENQPIHVRWPTGTLSNQITVTITNLSGQIVTQHQLTTTSNQIKLDANRIPANGTYFLTINDLDTYLVSKIVR